MGCKGSKLGGSGKANDTLDSFHDQCFYGTVKHMDKNLVNKESPAVFPDHLKAALRKDEFTTDVRTDKRIAQFPLFLAMQGKRKGIVKDLLNHGADIGGLQKGSHGNGHENVFHVGAYHNNYVGIKEALEWASENNQMEICTKMIGTSHEDSALSTPLNISCSKGSAKIVALFINKGKADPTKLDHQGMDALAITRFWRDHYVLRKEQNVPNSIKSSIKNVEDFNQIESILTGDASFDASSSVKKKKTKTSSSSSSKSKSSSSSSSSGTSSGSPSSSSSSDNSSSASSSSDSSSS